MVQLLNIKHAAKILTIMRGGLSLHSMQLQEISELYHSPLIELVRRAAKVHVERFPAGGIQPSTLLSIKTGGCPEDCSYCPQSAHYKTGVTKTGLMEVDEVLKAAKVAKADGATRFCMGAAWREIRDGSEFDQVLDMVSEVAKLDLEVCCTLGLLSKNQAARLKQAGLDFYNHNLDTSRAYYEKVVQTRTYADRLDTIANVRAAGLAVCTGGILGLGESHDDRIAFISELIHLQPIPESITINTLVPFAGTPLAGQVAMDPLDVVRVVASLRILCPESMIRLSAGRMALSTESQFLCFLSGANSIFLGEKLLTSPNAKRHDDEVLLDKLGMQFQAAVHEPHDRA